MNIYKVGGSLDFRHWQTSPQAHYEQQQKCLCWNREESSDISLTVSRHLQQERIKDRRPAWLAQIKRVETNTDIILWISTAVPTGHEFSSWAENPHHGFASRVPAFVEHKQGWRIFSSAYLPLWKRTRTKQNPLLLENFKHLALFGLSSGNGSQRQSTPSDVAAGRPGREAFLPGHR